jgi:hypothetical protein
MIICLNNGNFKSLSTTKEKVEITKKLKICEIIGGK